MTKTKLLPLIVIVAAAVMMVTASIVPAYAGHKNTEVLAQARDAAGNPVAGATCFFVYTPSGIIDFPVIANNGGIAKSSGAPGDTTAFVGCLTGIIIDINPVVALKAHGTTVVPLVLT